MTNAPVFNLKASNIDFDSDEALQAELDKVGNGKWFDAPGNYDLVISSAEFHKNKDTGDIFCKGDSTWFNVKLTLTAADERTIDHWIQVPTTSLKFGEKGTLAVFKKFQEFLIGIGEVVTIPKLQTLLEKYFADPKKLVGQKVNVDIGYEGPFVAKAADSDEYVVMVKGQPLKDEGVEVRMPDRGSAVQYAKSQGIEPSFIRILKFTAKKPAKALKAASADW
jgi:hypothetical protein